MSESAPVSSCRRFHLIACRVLWREFCYFASYAPSLVTFEFLDQGLHNTPEQLRENVQVAVENAPREADAILLGYGLCSNGLEGIRAGQIPLVLPRAHDCITLLLGSKTRYREYFDAHPGTYWYSPGWIELSEQPGRERYERIYLEYVQQYGTDNAAYLMEAEQNWFREYSRATYVSLFDKSLRQEDRKYTRNCADWLGWDYDECAGDPGLIVRMLDGRWNKGEFLVVPAGRRIAATHDEMIVKDQA